MSIVPNPVSIELDDIQGVVKWGYGNLPANKFLFLTIENAEKVQKWIHSLVPMVSCANRYEPEIALNIAFTWTGLQALGLSEENLQNFPYSFREGMTTPNRQRILGDFGKSDPKNWRIGSADNMPHILLALYAIDEHRLDEFHTRHLEAIESVEGLSILFSMDGYRRDDNKEPFGFHDGISQPKIKGSGRKAPATDLVEAGEFVLGYLNEFKQYPFTPLITDGQGDLNLLPADPRGSGRKDLGKNGTFIAYRLIEQLVDEFWKFMEDKTKKPNGEVDENAKIKLASKMIGRWPGGTPLVKSPDTDPKVDSTDNDFNYAKLDPHGHKCPFGSHLRRNNPRDSFRDNPPKLSLKITNQHRIIRRGRLYNLVDENGVVKETGLHFMGINANIEQQFEFIQHIWANDPFTKGLTSDPDPVLGVPDPKDPYPIVKESRFTIQKDPVNQCIDGLQRFVNIRAGAYFFLPGLSALRYLSTLGDS